MSCHVKIHKPKRCDVVPAKPHCHFLFPTTTLTKNTQRCYDISLYPCQYVRYPFTSNLCAGTAVEFLGTSRTLIQIISILEHECCYSLLNVSITTNCDSDNKTNQTRVEEGYFSFFEIREQPLP